MVSSSDTLCTYILYRNAKKSIDILSKNEDFAHKHQLFHSIVQKDLKCIVRYDFSIYFCKVSWFKFDRVYAILGLLISYLLRLRLLHTELEPRVVLNLFFGNSLSRNQSIIRNNSKCHPYPITYHQYLEKQIQMRNKKERGFEGECYEKALSGTDFVQWYQIQNLCVDRIKK